MNDAVGGIQIYNAAGLGLGNTYSVVVTGRSGEKISLEDTPNATMDTASDRVVWPGMAGVWLPDTATIVFTKTA